MKIILYSIHMLRVSVYETNKIKLIQIHLNVAVLLQLESTSIKCYSVDCDTSSAFRIHRIICVYVILTTYIYTS